MLKEEYNYESYKEANFEEAVVKLFIENGYSYKKAEEVHRKYSDIIIEDDLKEYIEREYGDQNLTNHEISEIIQQVENVGSHISLYDNMKEAYYLITRETFILKRDDNSLPSFNIKYIDFDNVENNVFKIINQYVVEGQRETKRPDLLVFINGIPVAIWEFKTALDENKTIKDAWEQIHNRYVREIDNLLKYCFLSVISDFANTRLASPLTDYKNYCVWNRVNFDRSEDTNNISGFKSLETMIKGAFAPERILDILRDFVIFPETSKSDAAPIVCRYPQYFGAKIMADNIVKHIEIGDGKGGTYFGAMGGGKTYQMLFMAELLMRRYNEETKNATIIVIEDRDDLQDQTIEKFGEAKSYLEDDDVRQFDSRSDLHDTLIGKLSGGVYVTTIQKFCKETGFLSDRKNIIVIADEAHRTQLDLGEKTKYVDGEIITTTGFGKILRDSLPNAIYCGFTGTPIEETISVFGDVVDSLTMEESVEAGITTDITYIAHDPKLFLDREQCEEIDKYYKQCFEEGSSEEQIEASKRAEASISAIYSNRDVIHKQAEDIVKHYESMCKENPGTIQKAMIVCTDRKHAYKMYKEISSIRSDWIVPKKAEDESLFNEDKLIELPKVSKMNLVITEDRNDEKEMYNLAGNREKRKSLAKIFKNDESNFRIAVVSDMWITGFDVKSLTELYLIKPVQKHQLIQTISRVNRIWEGKNYGIVVDYMKLGDKLQEAIHMYNNDDDFKVQDIPTLLIVFRNQLEYVSAQMNDFDSSVFFDSKSSELERGQCIDDATIFVQRSKATRDEFMDSVLDLKKTYSTLAPTGQLTKEEIGEANFYIAIRSVIYKETKGDAPNTEKMNEIVEEMVQNALTCTGIEPVFEETKNITNLFKKENIDKIRNLDDGITKINGLLKVSEAAITSYERLNPTKSEEFSDMLNKIIKDFNGREKKILTANDSFAIDIINRLYDLLDNIRKDNEELNSSTTSKIVKPFYDILLKEKKQYNLNISDNDCQEIAEKIVEILEKYTQYADWPSRTKLISTMDADVTCLLAEYNFDLQKKDDMFKKIIDQAEKMAAFINESH